MELQRRLNRLISRLASDFLALEFPVFIAVCVRVPACHCSSGPLQLSKESIPDARGGWETALQAAAWKPPASEALTGPAPCDDCKRHQRCATTLPCSAFALYVSGATEERWANAPRVDAARETFKWMFSAREIAAAGDIGLFA